MKILMISSIPENLEKITGGIESVTFNLLGGFSNLDVKLDVISFRKEVKKEKAIEFSPNINIHYYPFRFIKSVKLFFYLFGSATVYKQIELLKPDIIHVQGNGSILLLLKKLKSKNIVVTPHADLNGEYQSLIELKKKINHRMVIFIQNLVIRKLHNYIFISEYIKNLFIKNRALGIINSQAIIYNPVKQVFFNVKDNEQKNRLNILYVGLINKRKGLVDLIEGLGDLKCKGIEYHLNVVGGFIDNIYEDLIHSKIKENKLESQVSFCGWQSQEEIVKLMEESGIFVLPSNQESMPMSIIESMSSGRLVIASDVGGISEIIKDGETGYLFKKNDVKQLASILENLFNDPSKFVSISRNARAFAKSNFSPDLIAQKTYKFYSSVLNNNAN